MLDNFKRMTNPDKVRELEGILQRLKMGYRELADAAAINPETMRKYVRGYQTIPDDKMAHLKQIELVRNMQGSQVNEEPVAYRTGAIRLGILPNDALDYLFSLLAAELTRQSEPKRSQIIQALKEVTDEQRERGRLPSDPRDEARKKLSPDLREIASGMEAVAEQSVRRDLRESQQSPPTGGQRAHGKRTASGDTGPESAVPKGKADGSGGQSKAHT